MPGKATDSWMVSKNPSKLCRAHGLNGLQRQDLSQQTCSPIVPGHVLYKNHNFSCIFVPWCNGENLPILRLVTTHWTKLLTDEFESWALFRYYNIPQTKHLKVSQCLYLGLFDAAKFPPPILSISFLTGLRINETELTDCGMSTCWADILLPPLCLSDF